MTESTENLAAFEALLNYLKSSRSFDFTGYKRPSLIRLTKKRMAKLGINSFSDYLDYIEVNPLEPNQLFDSLLLNVTTFFRDAEAWECLSQEIIPRILSSKGRNEPIRIWSAGCASGEEAYTLAILFAEALGIEAFRSRVKIYATDLDEDALATGRLAAYPAKQLQNIPEHLRDKYFEAAENAVIFRKELRRSIIFGRHDLIQNPPISRLDLLVCRNTLMYFNSETQARIWGRFHFALNDTGFLFVGKAEMLLTAANLFAPANLKYRIFSKQSGVSRRERFPVIPEPDDRAQESNQRAAISHLRDETFENQPVPQMVVDRDGTLAMANRLARLLFEISPQDLGRPLQDLEVSYKPAELRSPIQQVYASRAPVKIPDVELARANEPRLFLEIEVTPLIGAGGEELGACIDFKDVTRCSQLQRELDRLAHELETAGEELQSTNEELETTNEELQSTNEELETTNEELQSTNEELEAMNEELQSSNKDLLASNSELSYMAEELDRANALAYSVLTNLRVAVVVLSERLSVQLWNNLAEEMCGRRAEEVEGHFFFDLDVGLPVEQLREPIRACQTGSSDSLEVFLEAVNRRGQTISCRVICTPLMVRGAYRGIILLIEEK